MALEFGERADTSQDGALTDNSAAGAGAADSTFYEITIATVDQPKLLSRLSDAMVSLSDAQQQQQQQGGKCVLIICVSCTSSWGEQREWGSGRRETQLAGHS